MALDLSCNQWTDMGCWKAKQMMLEHVRWNWIDDIKERTNAKDYSELRRNAEDVNLER